MTFLSITPYHRVENAIPLLDIERQRMRRKQAHGLTAPGRTLGRNSAQASRASRATEKIGELVGLHRSTVEKARARDRMLRGDPKRCDRLSA